MRDVVRVLVLAVLVGLIAGCSSRSDGSPDGGDAAGSGAGASAGGSGGGGAGAASGQGGRGGDDSEGAGGDGGAAGSAGGTVDGGLPPGALELCGGPCECADGIDNDGDGFIDGFDPECIGPNDNDEGSFATGIPGDNRDPKWQDCFFDGNSGGGDDGCRYATGCLTGELPADHRDCAVTQRCIDFCAPRAPNGCDCFGCCTFTLAGGSQRSVVLDARCTKETIEDCMACVPSTRCGNECGRCELCPGKTIADLPSDCGSRPPTGGSGGSGGNGGSGGDDPPYTCDNGSVCARSSDCPDPSLQYCLFGCCITVLE